MNSRLRVTDTDARRLGKILNDLAGKDQAGAHELEEELERATIIDSKDIPSNVITMNSVVKFRLDPSGMDFSLRLVYPHDTGLMDKAVSVLAPVGCALLGLSVGDVIYWPKPGGGKLKVTIIDIEYQPERSGDYHL